MKSYICILIVIGFLIQGLFIKMEHEEKYVLADILKGSASLFFVLIGFIAWKSTGNPLNTRFLIGLIFGMIGDILLNLRYVFPEKGQKIF